MSEYRDGVEEPAPNWFLRRVMKIVRIAVICNAGLASGFGIYKCIQTPGCQHFDDRNWGWCYKKHHTWCRKVTECESNNGHFCERYSERERCDEIYEDWTRREGSDGEECP